MIMTMGRTVALAAAIVFASAASGSAQAAERDQDDFARNGPFVGFAGVYAINTFEDNAEDDINSALALLGYVATLDVDESFGVNVHVGYRFHPNFSAEFQVEWLDGFDADASVMALPVGDIATVEIEPRVFSLNAKGHLLTGRYQPFLLVGLGALTAKVEVEDAVGFGLSDIERFSGFAARFGGGIDVYATENIVVTVGADYVLPTGDVEDLDFVSIGWGFQYRF
jgi:opacity protein-like surface antigen